MIAVATDRVVSPTISGWGEKWHAAMLEGRGERGRWEETYLRWVKVIWWMFNYGHVQPLQRFATVSLLNKLLRCNVAKRSETDFRVCLLLFGRRFLWWNGTKNLPFCWHCLTTCKHTRVFNVTRFVWRTAHIVWSMEKREELGGDVLWWGWLSIWSVGMRWESACRIGRARGRQRDRQKGEVW